MSNYSYSEDVLNFMELAKGKTKDLGEITYTDESGEKVFDTVLMTQSSPDGEEYLILSNEDNGVVMVDPYSLEVVNVSYDDTADDMALRGEFDTIDKYYYNDILFDLTDDPEYNESIEYLGDPLNESLLKESVSNGIYSLYNGWIKEPKAEIIPDLDKEAFDAEFKKWEDRYNKIMDSSVTEDIDDVKSIIADQVRGEWEAIRNYNKAIKDLRDEGSYKDIEELLADIADEEEVHVGELQQAQSRIDSNVLDNIDDGEKEAEEKTHHNESLGEEFNNPKIEEIDSFIDDLYILRQNSLLSEGEYGIGNLVFKELRNKGMLQNLKDLKVELQNKEMSL